MFHSKHRRQDTKRKRPEIVLRRKNRRPTEVMHIGTPNQHRQAQAKEEHPLALHAHERQAPMLRRRETRWGRTPYPSMRMKRRRPSVCMKRRRSPFEEENSICVQPDEADEVVHQRPNAEIEPNLGHETRGRHTLMQTSTNHTLFLVYSLIFIRTACVAPTD
jgi:hypothetical protein